MVTTTFSDITLHVLRLCIIRKKNFNVKMATCLMGTNCAPLLADLSLYSHEADFIHGLLKKNEKKLARSLNFTFRYIDDVLTLNNSRLRNFVDRIYPIELEIKDATDRDRSDSYLDLHLDIDSEGG